MSPEMTVANPPPRGHSGLWLVPLLLFGAIAGGFATVVFPIQSFEAAYYGWAGQGWATTEGRVRTAGPEQSPGRRGPGRFLGVDYEYSVGGRLYRGTRLRFGDRMGFPDDRSARAYAQTRYPSGGPVTVHYRSADPGVAVLERGLHASWVWWAQALMMPLLCLVICVGACSMMWRALRGRLWIEMRR